MDDLPKRKPFVLVEHSRRATRMYACTCVACFLPFKASGRARYCSVCAPLWLPLRDAVYGTGSTFRQREFPELLKVGTLELALTALSRVGVKRITVSPWEGGCLYRQYRHDLPSAPEFNIMPNHALGFSFGGVSVEWGQM